MMTSSCTDCRSDTHSEAIFPVILSVPPFAHGLLPREKVQFLSAQARKALHISAGLKAVDGFVPQKDVDGVPLPYRGYYWSISHKADYVGGVLASAPTGLDIEKIRHVSKELMKKIASEKEWALESDTDKTILFFRFWTAKEAVLKAAGLGLKALSRCTIMDIVDANHLTAVFDQTRWHLEHKFFADHIASVVTNFVTVKWRVET